MHNQTDHDYAKVRIDAARSRNQNKLIAKNGTVEDPEAIETKEEG